MTYERFHATFVGVVAALVDSIVVAELAGYWLHRLLHNDKFPALSRGHLIYMSFGTRFNAETRNRKVGNASYQSSQNANMPRT